MASTGGRRLGKQVYPGIAPGGGGSDASLKETVE
jgi:hypothetical protein